MFFPVRFKTHIQLPPYDLNGDFDETIQAKMRRKLEGLCSRFGYIKPGSLEVIRRSAGIFMKQHFNGHIRFDVYCKGDVCNPPQGMVVEAIVKNKNALGLLAESSVKIDDKEIPILDIIVPRKATGIASEIDLEQVNIGDQIFVMVMGKRYQLNDTNISIIGRAVKQLTPSANPEVDEEINDDEVDDGVVDDTEDYGYASEEEAPETKTIAMNVAEEFGEHDDFDDEIDEDFEEGGENEDGIYDEDDPYV